eukprot:SAG31_NODE_57_length_29727_cov_12.584568_7_plen_153_part_00
MCLTSHTLGLIVCYRVELDGAAAIIYVADSSQSGHFAACFAAARTAGILQSCAQGVNHATELLHVQFGLVFDESCQRLRSRLVKSNSTDTETALGGAVDNVAERNTMRGWLTIISRAADEACGRKRGGAAITAEAAAVATIRYCELRRRREK